MCRNIHQKDVILKLDEKWINFEITDFNVRRFTSSFSKDCGEMPKVIIRLLINIDILPRCYTLRLYFFSFKN